MNNDRARDLLKTLKEYYTKIMPNVIPLQREDEKGKNELIQALDIAIESLEQDKETKEKMWAKQLNECEECEVINNEWVDVRDRLPSESGYYLVSIKGARETTTWFYGISSNEKGWDEFEGHEDIIAWRPLPQPYERKE